MKILKLAGIFMLAVFLAVVFGGCLDFAQQKNNFEERPLRTTYDGGSKTTILIQGIPVQRAKLIVNDILQQLEEQEQAKNFKEDKQ